MKTTMDLRVNGKTARVETESERSLLSVLRDDLDLTGAKYGCGEGQCGACTVLIDGAPIKSCITPVGTVGAKQLTTIEGLAQGGKLHAVQEAFIEADAMQCAYCTSGMILAASALLKKTRNPSKSDITRAINGNICRCGCYGRIEAAILLAAEKMR